MKHRINRAFRRWPALLPGLFAIFLAVPTSALHDPIHDLLIEPADLTIFGFIENDFLGASVAIGDVNGDGIADLVAGGPELGGSFNCLTGRVRVFFGSETIGGSWSLQQDPADVTILGPEFDNDLGIAVAVGDVNGDDIGDILMGAQGCNNDCCGGNHGSATAFVVFGAGSLGGVIDLAMTEADFSVVAGNGEYADSLIWVAAGDVNGDGVDDVLVGHPNPLQGTRGSGDLYVLFGSDSLGGTVDLSEDATDLTVVGALYFDGLGSSVAVGDIDNDGVDDIVVGAPNADPADRENAGIAYVLRGSPGLGGIMDLAESAAHLMVLGAESAGRLGDSLATGDFNGDSVDDLLLGSPGLEQTHVIFGSDLLGGVIDLGVSPSDFTVRGVRPLNSLAGNPVGSGDINADGIGDLIIGDHRFMDAVHVVLGSSALDGVLDLSTTAADFTILGWPGTAFGESVASGDANGDGIDDLLVGAPSRTSDPGAVYLFFGSRDNSPPTADGGSSSIVECVSQSGAVLTLDGSGSSDVDSTPGTNDDIHSFEWFEDFGLPSETLLANGEVVEIEMPVGRHDIALRVTDSAGETDADEVVKEVVDTTSPLISADFAPSLLWPPNHRMSEISAYVSVSDTCGTPMVVLASMTSNEPDNAESNGDGNTDSDIQNTSIGMPDFAFDLRAERAGSGQGRMYAATYVATDPSGNSSSAVSHVLVPHDIGGVTEPLVLQVHENGVGTLVTWNEVTGGIFYNVIRGSVSNLQSINDAILLGAVSCVEPKSTDTTTLTNEDILLPGPGEAFIYLVEYNDGWNSSYGATTAAKPRVVTSGDCQ